MTQINRASRASLSTIPPLKNINMKTIIIDTSALMAIIGNEPDKPKLIEVTQDAELIAPPSVHWEIGNAFSALFKKRQVTLTQALQAIQAYQQIPILFREVELTTTLQLCLSLNIYAYDAYLIASALQHDSPLLSLDRQLLKAAVKAGANIIEVSP